jgi:hypothetical protein
MLNSTFWQTFWLVFISMIASLGIALAMVAGAELAVGDYASVVAAVFMAAACGALCIMADEARRETVSSR